MQTPHVHIVPHRERPCFRRLFGCHAALSPCLLQSFKLSKYPVSKENREGGDLWQRWLPWQQAQLSPLPRAGVKHDCLNHITGHWQTVDVPVCLFAWRRPERRCSYHSGDTLHKSPSIDPCVISSSGKPNVWSGFQIFSYNNSSPPLKFLFLKSFIFQPVLAPKIVFCHAAMTVIAH